MVKAKIAVVGAGIIGLSTAVCISDSISDCSVTVIADRFTPNTTSDVAAGMLIPHTYPVNCSGIGSRKLIGDLEIYPTRGQVLKVHAPWVTHFIRDGDGLTYIYPGIHNITLGGTRQKDDWNLSLDPSISKNIFSRCCALEPSLQAALDVQVKVGLRPSRSAVRVQKETLVRGSEKLLVVHNYGHGGGGFSVHQGTAKEATQL
ncbi:hypothetical protein JD844_024326, partial [Phrynosoma platyrhinos]